MLGTASLDALKRIADRANDVLAAYAPGAIPQFGDVTGNAPPLPVDDPLSVAAPPGAWFLTAGEGLHNNHHAATTSSRLSLARGEFDPAWWVVRVMVRFKMATVRHINITPKTPRRLPVGV